LERGRFFKDGIIFKLLLYLEKISYGWVSVKDFEFWNAACEI
jgi:hypothetical protein